MMYLPFVRIRESVKYLISPHQTVFAVGIITPDMTRLNSKLTSAGCCVPFTVHYVFTAEYEDKLPVSFLANLARLKMYAPITKTIMIIGTAACSNMFWIVFQSTGR